MTTKNRLLILILSAAGCMLAGYTLSFPDVVLSGWHSIIIPGYLLKLLLILLLFGCFLRYAMYPARNRNKRS
ncbi:hypothetical protein [Sphingobacterium suaedae]|uniref:Uncharacterized protein n=1 Tax=Sphingobacterium suaedae TaxID=1686402 RepID=A0ABW5KEB1_9SPHI